MNELHIQKQYCDTHMDTQYELAIKYVNTHIVPCLAQLRICQVWCSQYKVRTASCGMWLKCCTWYPFTAGHLVYSKCSISITTRNLQLLPPLKPCCCATLKQFIHGKLQLQATGVMVSASPTTRWASTSISTSTYCSNPNSSSVAHLFSHPPITSSTHAAIFKILWAFFLASHQQPLSHLCGFIIYWKALGGVTHHLTVQ